MLKVFHYVFLQDPKNTPWNFDPNVDAFLKEKFKISGPTP